MIIVYTRCGESYLLLVANMFISIYLQIKKVRLRRENDAKILREVNALSRMSHSSIVRYYTVSTFP